MWFEHTFTLINDIYNHTGWLGIKNLNKLMIITRSTQQYVVSLDRKLNADSSGVNAVVVYKHLWSLERILVGNSQKIIILNHKTPSNV